jgi:hypothetical protein
MQHMYMMPGESSCIKENKAFKPLSSDTRKPFFWFTFQVPKYALRRKSASRIISNASFKLGAKSAYKPTSATILSMMSSSASLSGTKFIRIGRRDGDIVAPIISSDCDIIESAPCHMYGMCPA